MSEKERFRRVVVENIPAITAYLRRRLHPLAQVDLDDIVEETLIVAWRRFDRCPEAAERPWLIGIARNVMRNAKRGFWRRAAFEATLSWLPEVKSPEDVVVSTSLIREALDQLAPIEREALLLKAWDGLSSREIAVVLGLTPKAAESRVSRATDHFRHSLSLKTGTTTGALSSQGITRN
jgi:RNA polymerase sigma-70 factor (ECF subfamily)